MSESKQRLVDRWRALLQQRLDTLDRSVRSAREGTRVDGGHRPANRGERGAVTAQGYLAHGLAQRREALREALALLDEVALASAPTVRAGSLVTVEDTDTEALRRFFILPGAQGDTLDGVTLISPQAPVARALAGREVDDEARWEQAGRVRELLITALE